MHPSPFQDAIAHGEQLFHAGHIHEALQVFDAVIDQEPHNVLALNNRGVILHSLQRYAEAEQACLSILEQDEANANAVFNLSTIYIDQYRLNSAEDVLVKYGKCLTTEDINELKAKLYKMQNEINMVEDTDKTKLFKYLYGCEHKKT